jgi:hypothetical protein
MCQDGQCIKCTTSKTQQRHIKNYTIIYIFIVIYLIIYSLIRILRPTRLTNPSHHIFGLMPIEEKEYIRKPELYSQIHDLTIRTD